MPFSRYHRPKREGHLRKVLGGSLQCTEESIKIYLDRMVCFPNCLYLLLNAHKLSGIAQEKILSFMSHHGIMSKNIHFHIIQSGPTLFHASPWVQRREWDNASITSIKSSTISDWLKRAVIDNSHISSITIVSSKTSRSGKTNYIRKEMIGLQAKSDCQVAVVNILIELANSKRYVCKRKENICRERHV